MEYTAVKKKTKCKIIMRVIIALCVLFVLLLWFGIPIPVNRTVPALEISLTDPNHVIERTVTVQGTYTLNPLRIIRPNREFFTGDIWIEWEQGNRELFRNIRLGTQGEGRWQFGPAHQYLPGESRRWNMVNVYPEFMFREAVFEIREVYYHRIVREQEPIILVLNATTLDQAIEIMSRSTYQRW